MTTDENTIPTEVELDAEGMPIINPEEGVEEAAPAADDEVVA